MVSDPHDLPVITCFLGLESKNINTLVLISFCLARGRFAKGSSGNSRGRLDQSSINNRLQTEV